ncbi:peptidylprolyl isomerase [Bordetella genomosp. 5]|uniref:SurA N-terminal domain-containing protein n=1 Tax=Bordetella genomosp. 5 TaxID=1395608 RepID=UPI000B9EB1E5|nr:SurA N-terminal domain-containing protein [Bordetella genomosp. 5]OZI44882.1 peptidylprolyl isomerase [Bordetella genomosp. 5]
MFETIRNHRRWLQFILLILIVPSFGLVGMSGYDSFVSRDPELATVAGQAITRPEFDAAHRNQLEQFRQRMGAQFDPAVVDTPAMRQQLLDQLIDQRLLAQVAIDNRFSVSDATLRNTIAAIPQVQDEGRFSPERYRQVLAAQGMSPTSFENGLRRDLAVARVLEPVGTTARLPGEVVGSLQQALSQQRTLQLRVFTAEDFRSKVTVTPEDIQTWYDANQESLRVPEQVQAQYLVLDEAAATQGVQVSDADVTAYYEQNKNRFGTPEQRRASHILIQVPSGANEQTRKDAEAKAKTIAAEAAANPAGFAELAKKESQDAGSAATGGDLGWISGNAVPAEIIKAVAGLAKDQVSDVVRSPYGYHILKLTDLKEGQAKPLAEVREQITTEIRRQIAATRFAEMATKMNTLVYDTRDNLQPTADALGLKLRSAAGITRTGLLSAEQAGPGAAATSADAQLLDNPRVRQVLFSPEVLRDKLNSGVITLSPDTMVAVRVAQVTPSQIPPLDKVRDAIRARLTDERAAAAAKEAGEAALKAAQAAPQTVPEGFGEAMTVSRQAPLNLPRPVLDLVMRQPAGSLPAYGGAAVGVDYVVVRVEKIEPGTAPEQDRDMLARQLSGAWGEAEDQAVLKMLREAYKVQTLPAANDAIKGEATAEG